jgi:hypothetical protein
MPPQQVDIFWHPSSLLRDDRLLSRRFAKLFFLSAILVIALTPVFAGVDTTKMSFWRRLPWGLLGVFGPIGLLFLWFGMWRYWVRIDNSEAGAKRLWFFVLLIGFWWGSALYCFFVYLPQVFRKTRGVT